jgi:hypothetical protein
MNDAFLRESRHRLQALLDPARQILERGMAADSARRSALLAGSAILAVGLVELTAILLRRGPGASVPDPVHAFGATVVAIAALYLGFAAWQARRQVRCTWEQAAHQLDLACDPHDRIRSAWSLVDEGRDTAFGMAAVAQGLETLRRNLHQSPARLARIRQDWRAGLRLAVTATVCGWLVLWASLPPKPSPAIPEEKLHQPNRAGPVAAASRPSPTSAPRPELAPAPPLAATSPATESGMYTALNTGTPAGAASGETAALGAPRGTPRGLGTENSRRGQADHMSAQDGNTARPGRSGRSSQDSRSEIGKTEASPSAGAIAAGGAGLGKALAVRSQAAQRETPGDAELQASLEDAEPDEQVAGNEQRGGVQPSLPDRTEAPSRELGITGQQSGRPGTGRGGPSPAKKARGAASLLMGVPVPDFVKGKAGPGPTAVASESMNPVAAPQESVPGGRSGSRQDPEALIPQHDIPRDDANVVQEYLRRWQQRQGPGAASPADEKPATTTNEGTPK